MNRRDKLKSDLNKLETVFQSPRIFLANHFNELRNQIDIECEKFLQAQNDKQSERALQALDFQSRMIEQVGRYEQECLAHSPANKLDNELAESIRNKLKLLEQHVKELTQNQLREATYSEVNGLVLDTLDNILRFLFMNREMVLLTGDCPLVREIDARVQSDFDVFQFRVVKSFGVLLIIRDEFIGLDAILKSSETKYGETQQETSFKIKDLMLHLLKTDLQSSLLHNPVHSTELKLSEKSFWDLQFKRITDLNLSPCVASPHTSTFIHLSSINLSSNNLTTLDPNTFQGLHNLESLYLRHNRFTTLDPNIFKGLCTLKHLYLDHNKLTAIKLNVFNNLVNLKILNLNYTDLESLEPGVFNDLRNLKQLFLGYVKLSHLDDSVFRGLDKLEKLHLNHNKLVRIDQNAFSFLTNLKFLYLNNNMLSWLEPKLFQGMKNLEKLCLNENKLVWLDSSTFNGLVGIRTIYLDRNELAYLDPNLFEGLFELETLILSHNRLSSVSTFCFRDQAKLAHLFLECNQLAYFEPEILKNFGGLRTLQLKGNQISDWIKNVLTENYVKQKNQRFEFSI